MQLASHYLRDLPARSLTACCAAARIELSQHHSALYDARAAAHLLARFRATHRRLPGSWEDALTSAASAAWVPCPPQGQFGPVTRDQQTLRRASQRPPLAYLVDRLPRGPGGDIDAYLGMLDKVLEDRIVTGGELASLTALALDLGLTRDAAGQAHRQYLRHVSAAAWQDSQVTDAERADLLEVSRLLGVPAAEALTILEDAHATQRQPHRTPAAALHARDRVVFTGDMTMNRAEIEALATAAGLHVTSSVSARTTLVIAADPYSQSGKASLARKLGTRMVTEQVFLHMLDGMQPAEQLTPPT